jgi:hypothetical protein
LNDIQLVGEAALIKIMSRIENNVDSTLEEDVYNSFMANDDSAPNSSPTKPQFIAVSPDSGDVQQNLGKPEEVAVIASMLQLLESADSDTSAPLGSKMKHAQQNPPQEASASSMPPPPPPLSGTIERVFHKHAPSFVGEKEPYGFYASKRGGLFPAYKRRYFQIESTTLISYWTSEETAKESRGGERTAAAGYRGQIRVDTLVRIATEVSIRDNKAGRVYRLQMESDNEARLFELEYEALEYYARKKDEFNAAKEEEKAGTAHRSSDGWFWGAQWGRSNSHLSSDKGQSISSGPQRNSESSESESEDADDIYTTFYDLKRDSVGVKDSVDKPPRDIVSGSVSGSGSEDWRSDELPDGDLMFSTLGSGNLGVEVVKPVGFETNEWVTMNTIDFCNEVSALR